MSSFVGRERELARGLAALRDARVVTLTEVGGVGKTRLALQLAAEAVSWFRDGAWLVELGAVRDPGGVPDACAAVFGVSPRAGESVADALVEFLRTKQLLLVIDNCEHVLEEVADLVEQIERSCRGVPVLATSREGLALDGERIVAVPSLAAPPRSASFDEIAGADAVALFVERAQRADADFELTAANAGAVARVCWRLDGVPLAIELAAARVRAMSPDELARGLDHRFETLAGGRRRAVERHQTLRAAIDWSYELLSEPERRLLARLSVFAGGCTREGAEEVCGTEPLSRRDVFELLSRLVDRSLVVTQRGGPDTRYRLLETIRAYAEERLAEREETGVLRARHAEYVCELLRTSAERSWSAQQVEVNGRLEAEMENELAARVFAVDTRDDDLLLRLLRHRLHAGGQYSLSSFPMLVDMTVLEELGDHPLLPAALAYAANEMVLRGDIAAANDLIERAQLAASRLGDQDKAVEILALQVKGLSAMNMGAFRAAAEAHVAAANAVRTSSWPRGVLAHCLGSAASFFVYAGDLDAALPLALEGLEIARADGVPSTTALNLVALAAAVSGTDPERAHALLREGVAIARSLGHDITFLTTQGVFVGAYLEDVAVVYELAPQAIRGLSWGNSVGPLGGVVSVVAAVVADSSPEAAAVLQGIAHQCFGRLSTRARAAPAEDAGLVVRLLRRTTKELTAALGPEQLAELRARGVAMSGDDAVAYALTAVSKLA